MIYAFDTFYRQNLAHTACLAFANWTTAESSGIFQEDSQVPSDYESGAFYKRELPCILSLLEKIELSLNDTLVVDGYVRLNADGKLGLGGYLFQALGEKIPVIGLAKNEFKQADPQRRTIFRGNSTKALFVTAVGLDVDQAADNIKRMHGAYRMPTLLTKLDQLSRGRD